MGGQVADHGYLVSGDAKLKVTQVKKTPKGYFVHTCELLDGTIHVDDEVTASVDEKRRAAICRNHTATHLLQKALREVLGEHVHQAGSYQDDQITHFDFTHFSAVSPAELAEVERRVNEKIYEALPVTVKNLPIEEAKKMGAMALFGEKYGSVVRVVDAGGWSTEFCGGTHVANTAQIGCFKILSESSVAAGIRRIEATTAFGVLDLLDDRTEILAKTAVALKANNLKDAPARAEALAAELKETAKQLEILKAQMAAAKIDGLFENAADIDGVRIVSAYLTGTGADTLRDMVDKVRDKAPNAVTVLIGSDGNKMMMAVGVSKNALARGLKAGALAEEDCRYRRRQRRRQARLRYGRYPRHVQDRRRTERCARDRQGGNESVILCHKIHCKKEGFRMEDCLFCKIAAGDIPSTSCLRTSGLAFYDIDPQAPCILVIPKQHIASAAALTEDDAALLGHIYAVIAQLCKKLGVDESGYRVVTNVGADGGQSVKHLHFHVLAEAQPCMASGLMPGVAQNTCESIKRGKLTWQIPIHCTFAGLTRSLPICKVNDHMDIAAFIMFSDVELTEACAAALLKKAPEFDVILTAEAKGIPRPTKWRARAAIWHPAAKVRAVYAGACHHRGSVHHDFR